MTREEVTKALISAVTSADSKMVPRPVVQDDQVLYPLGSVRVYAKPVMHTNEIEVRLELGDASRAYPQDAILAWLGVPIRSFMFSKGTVEEVARQVADIIEAIFKNLPMDLSQAKLYLDSAGEKLSQESLQNWIEEQAEEAWRNRRYEDVIDLYSRLGNSISRVQKKRLEIARQHV